MHLPDVLVRIIFNYVSSSITALNLIKLHPFLYPHDVSLMNFIRHLYYSETYSLIKIDKHHVESNIYNLLTILKNREYRFTFCIELFEHDDVDFFSSQLEIFEKLFSKVEIEKYLKMHMFLIQMIAPKIYQKLLNHPALTNFVPNTTHMFF